MGLKINGNMTLISLLIKKEEKSILVPEKLEDFQYGPL